MIASAAGGCVQPKPTPDQLARGYILLLPGVENQSRSLTGVVAGLRDAGIDQAVEVNQWGYRLFGTFRNLEGYKVNRTKAAGIARNLTEYHHNYPQAPITLIGYSAGGAMAVFTAETLPPEIMLDRVILLAPALSPGYDLSGATIHRIVNLHGERCCMSKVSGAVGPGKVLFIAAVLISGVSGCAGRLPMPLEPDQLGSGCLVMLPGVDGDEMQLTQTVRGLRQAGCRSAVDIIVWGGQPFGFVVNLIDYHSNLKRAERIAVRIAEYRRDAPHRPIVLVGFSGGGGIAVLAAEALPEGVKVDRIVLVAAAISPYHDLSKAVAHTRYGLVSFYSLQDRFLLGFGTRLLGTIDRKYTAAAGHVGFRDGDGNLLESPDVKQIAWRGDWTAMGCDGGHMGWLSRRWARRILAPEIVPLPAIAQRSE